jgi:hypothetical protein
MIQQQHPSLSKIFYDSNTSSSSSSPSFISSNSAKEANHAAAMSSDLATLSRVEAGGVLNQVDFNNQLSTSCSTNSSLNAARTGLKRKSHAKHGKGSNSENEDNNLSSGESESDSEPVDEKKAPQMAPASQYLNNAVVYNQPGQFFNNSSNSYFEANSVPSLASHQYPWMRVDASNGSTPLKLTTVQASQTNGLFYTNVTNGSTNSSSSSGVSTSSPVSSASSSSSNSSSNSILGQLEPVMATSTPQQIHAMPALHPNSKISKSFFFKV